MRVLTKQEKQIFSDAFTCIMRVASCTAESITEIRAGGERLPSVYIDLSQQLGGFNKLNHHFCPLYQEETTERLKKFCFNNRIQPREFIFNGLISVEKYAAPVREYTYMEASA